MKHQITQFPFLAGLNIMLGTSIVTGTQPGEKIKPNIMIIVADDATYNDLSLYGGKNVNTPNIDNLAGQGLIFNRAFVSMSMSAPCRTSLYTGLYPVNNGACWNHAPARNNTRSIVHWLGELGYRVGLAGKIHVSPQNVFPFEMVEGLDPKCASVTVNFQTTEMSKFIRKNDQQPFCLIAALVVPHQPWTVGDTSHFNPKHLELPAYLADTHETREYFTRYLAEIEVLDQQVGLLLEMLNNTGTTENTIVLFTSEQGASLPGCKWTNWNTGVHTGFIARWPGKIQEGKRTDAIIQYEDVLPTLIEAAGGRCKPNDFDGSSFLPVLLGKKKFHREFAYFMHSNVPEGTSYPVRSITDGSFHYIRNLNPENIYIEKHIMAGMSLNNCWSSWILQASDNECTYNLITRYMIRPREQLYNVDLDPNELTDLANVAEFAKVKERLSAQLDQWMRKQGDPGAEIDTKDQFENAMKGRHFKSVIL